MLDTTKFDRLCEQAITNTTKMFYPRNLKFSEKFLAAFKEEYNLQKKTVTEEKGDKAFSNHFERMLKGLRFEAKKIEDSKKPKSKQKPKLVEGRTIGATPAAGRMKAAAKRAKHSPFTRGAPRKTEPRWDLKRKDGKVMSSTTSYGSALLQKAQLEHKGHDVEIVMQKRKWLSEGKKFISLPKATKRLFGVPDPTEPRTGFPNGIPRRVKEEIDAYLEGDPHIHIDFWEEWINEFLSSVGFPEAEEFKDEIYDYLKRRGSLVFDAHNDS